ncbi:hypothetical protein QUB60_14385 [Microcoleus sp. A2-C5]|uniref:hypothetical protein n=1 Tax=unclassified Microcoleus TaxID=2642155 RepID=UPI002FD27DBC
MAQQFRAIETNRSTVFKLSILIPYSLLLSPIPFSPSNITDIFLVQLIPLVVAARCFCRRAD